ncbi:unnamed protein product [Ranitomeya imitator]|uniref:Tetratricopeptide repeat protein 4 n=1 Tax=Ranitomeya imitator TaxID=111125 RepID=A0ABN9KUM1_9NEOB|nr:unnamed protein product [Ranitomeya imitator]
MYFALESDEENIMSYVSKRPSRPAGRYKERAGIYSVRIGSPLPFLGSQKDYEIFIHKLIRNLFNEGNDLYREGIKEESINQYTEALNIASYASSEEIAISSETLEKLHVNRAASYIDTGFHEDALRDCEDTLHINDKNLRALYCKSKALFTLERYKEAYEAVAKCSIIAPKDDSVVKLTHELALKLGLKIRKAYVRTQFHACNQGKHRVTKRGPALSYPMFTLVTRGPRHRWSLESCLCDSSPATTLRFTYDHGQVISLVVIVAQFPSCSRGSIREDLPEVDGPESPLVPFSTPSLSNEPLREASPDPVPSASPSLPPVSEAGLFPSALVSSDTSALFPLPILRDEIIGDELDRILDSVPSCNGLNMISIVQFSLFPGTNLAHNHSAEGGTQRVSAHADLREWTICLQLSCPEHDRFIYL